MEKWTIDTIKEGFEIFFKEYNRYPTAHEIDSYKHLPSSRQIQRKFGGLPAIRKELKLLGPINFTMGTYSKERARKINRRSHKIEGEVYLYLLNKFGKVFVHREFFFIDDKRTRTDFYIYYKGGTFSVDVFYPENYKNMIGCINSKMRTYKSEIMINYPVIFLMMNDEITEEEIEKIIDRKKKPIHKNQKIMNYKQFKKFCSSKKRLAVGGGEYIR